jgi:hypothetical protein
MNLLTPVALSSRLGFKPKELRQIERRLSLGIRASFTPPRGSVTVGTFLALALASTGQNFVKISV